MKMNNKLFVLALALVAVASFDCSATWRDRNGNKHRTVGEATEDVVGGVGDAAADVVGGVVNATGDVVGGVTGEDGRGSGHYRDGRHHRRNRRN